jgi:transcriptional regulator with XRE-family HTH domain
MNRDVIASNIKMLRNAHHWSQEELALAAGVDVRTIQRAEAGSSLSLETLKSIAAAFDTSIEALQVSQADIEAAVAEFKKTHVIITMRVVTKSADLGDLIGQSEAFIVERIGDLTESQLDSIAEFQETLRDYLDIWRDLQMSGRRDAEKFLFDMVARFSTDDMSVSFGLESMPLRLGQGSPFRMSVLNVAVTKGSVPMLAIVRPKKMDLTFA